MVCMAVLRMRMPVHMKLHTNTQIFVVKSILWVAHLIWFSFALIFYVSEFRNKNADKRSEAKKQQKEKRRKLNEETLPQKENDPADDAKENGVA